MGDSAYQVTIKYVDKEDNLLWSDQVDVKGYGYQYTLPNTFSMALASGVDLFTLDSVEGGAVKQVESQDQATTGTALVLAGDMVDADFVMEDGKRTVKAVYDSQAAKGEVTFTLWEVDGSTGNRLSAQPIELTVTPEQDAEYVPAAKEIDGTTYVPWARNNEPMKFTWADLAAGADLMQNIYYVPEGFVPEEGYDITVNYVNVVDPSSPLRTQTIAVDPETNDFITIVGDERFDLDGEQYVRLSGQEAGIRHAYFSPSRTYTVYYRNVNDVINANTTVTRTQIIETPRYVVVPGQTITVNQPAEPAPAPAGLTAAPVAVPAADGAAAGVDAGVAAGDGTTVIDDNENPLANNEGVDTATERTIEDNENPLASGSTGPDWGLIAGIGIAVLAAIGLGAFLVNRRRNNANKNNA